MAKETEKKSVGEHVDRAIEKTKHHAKRSKEFVKEKLGGATGNRKTLWIAAAVVAALILIFLVWWIATAPDEKATTAQAQDIAQQLKAENVTIQGIRVTRQGYEVTYAAESAVGRFDDALIYDWGMIYGTAAAHDCDYVTIVTTLDGQPVHSQTAPCEAVRAMVRGVLTEAEFEALVQHKSLA